jgi:hypothetical protein
MKANFLRNPFLFSLILAGSLALIYSSLWSGDNFLDYDDFLVIEPMRDVRTLHQYWDAWSAGTVYDLQPVRDFVTWIDFSLLSWFNFSAFHLTNVVIWFATMIGLYQLVTFVPESRKNWMRVGVLLIAVNPLYVTSVAWLSARKHILAACFIVWATFQFLKWFNQDQADSKSNQKPLLCAYLFYLFGVLSQPIVVLWPVFIAGIMIVYGRRDRWKKIIFFFVIMLAVIYANSLYYASPQYLKLSYGIPKVSVLYNSILSIRLFALGRYIFQVFVPYWTSLAIYDFSSWRGLVGIFLLPISFYLSIKLVGRKLTFLAYGFFVLMLLPVVLRMTQIFGADTYIVSASFGLYFLFFLGIATVFRRCPKILASLAYGLFLFLILLSRERAMAWNTDVSAFGVAWKLEQSLTSGEDYLHALMHAKQNREAVWYAEDILGKFPDCSTAQGVVAHAIANDPDLTTAQKIEKIYNYHFFSAYSLVILADLEFTLKNYQNSEQILLKALAGADWRRIVHGQQEEYAAKIYHRCELAKDKECDAKAGQVRKLTELEWNEADYEKEKLKQDAPIENTNE